jgi:hypothetical protein
MKNYY